MHKEQDMSELSEIFERAKAKLKTAADENTTAELSPLESSTLYALIGQMSYVSFGKSEMSHTITIESSNANE